MVTKQERKKQIIFVFICSILLAFLSVNDVKAADYVADGWTIDKFKTYLSSTSESSSTTYRTQRKITLVNAYDTVFCIQVQEDYTGNTFNFNSGSGGYIPTGVIVKGSSGYTHEIRYSKCNISQSGNNQILTQDCDTRGVTPYLVCNKYTSRPGYTLTKVEVTKEQDAPYGTTIENGTGTINTHSDTSVIVNEDDFDIYIGAKSPVTEVTFYWKANTFTVKYNANGGTGTMADTTHTYGTAKEISANTFKRTGYTFNGWYVYRKSDNKWFYGNGTSKGWYVEGKQPSGYVKVYYTDETEIATTSPVDKDTVTMYAQWKPNTYTVTLNGNGATSTNHTTSVTATYDATMLTITKPSRSYKVTYNANGGSCSTTSTTANYTFNGYYDAKSNGTQYYKADGSSAKNWDKTSATTLYAQWTSKAITLPTPTRTGYIFQGWYDAASGGNKIGDAGASYTPTAAITLYAQWTPNNYTYDIIYKSSSGVQLGTSIVTKAFDTTNTISPKAFTGYTSPANQSIKWDSTDSKTITFIYTPIEYIITYELNGGTNPNSGVVNKFTIETATFNLLTPTRTGYTFKGWFTNSALSGTAVSQVEKGSYGNKTFYAKWQANTYTIKFDPNNKATTPNNIHGDAFTTDPTGTTESVTATYDSNVTLTKNGFTRTGYTFKGWSKTANSKTAEFTDGQTLTKPNFKSAQGDSIILYAIWEPITYTIKFHSNDDSLGNWNTTDSYTQTNVRFDQPTKLTANKFTRTAPFILTDGTEITEGYTFIGWSAKEDDISTLISEQATVISLTSSSTVEFDLYANWQKDISLTFNMNEGLYKDKDNDIETKQPITLSASIYNNQYTYTFNIDDGTTPVKNNYYTVQTGEIKAYGTSTGTKKASTLVNGENSILTKFTTDGTNYRFLGWNFSASDQVPNNQFDVFADGSIKSNKNTRISNYTIYDDTTLYAIWEPILTVDLKLDRVLGSLNANEVSSSVSKKTSDGKQSIDLTIQSGEQAQYQVVTTGRSSKQLQVEFDSRIIDIYTHGDSNSPWYDELNRLTDLNKTINPLDKIYTTKFFIPKYLGTASSYATSQYNPDKSNEENEPIWNYTIQFKVYQDSYYYENYRDIKEQVEITANIHLNNTSSDNDDIIEEDPIDSILEKLKVRLKLKLKI